MAAEWIDPRYEDVVEEMDQANADRHPADRPVRGFIVPAPAED